MAMSPGYGLKLLVGPTQEPIQPSDMLAHSRILAWDADNGLIQTYITAAREYVETKLHRQLLTAQYLLTLDQFPGRQVDDYRPPTWRYGIIRMPLPPLQSVQSVQYVDPGQSTQPYQFTTLDPSLYQVSLNTEPGRVAPAAFQVWPATNPLVMEAINITFTCGWTAPSLIPARIIHAIKMLVAHMYDNREPVVENAASKLPYGLRTWLLSGGSGEYN